VFAVFLPTCLSAPHSVACPHLAITILFPNSLVHSQKAMAMQVDGWEVLSAPSSCGWRYATLEDDASSVISTESTTSTNSNGWPSLATRQPASAVERQSLSYLDALLQGGGGLTGKQADNFQRACRRQRIMFVPRERFHDDDEDDFEGGLPDADEEWWIRKGHGATMARLRWHLDRRPASKIVAVPPVLGAKAPKETETARRSTVVPQRRRAVGPHVEPLYEYECGASAIGYQQCYKISDSWTAEEGCNW